MDWLTDPQIWIALGSLTMLEIVLGIDNVIFITILAERLPEEERGRARSLGLFMAMFMRIALLLSLSAIMALESELIRVFGRGFSGRDLILLLGGLFLLAKSTREIHCKLEGGGAAAGARAGAPSLGSVILQIMVLDLVFSLDSVITAVGMVDQVPVMIAAIVGAVLVMLLFARAIGDFVAQHPTVKMLALAFLLLIGMSLVAESFHSGIPKGYIYFAMGFSVLVELLNLRERGRGSEPLKLRSSWGAGQAEED